MAKAEYTNNVFINCPFDAEYLELRNAMIFAIYDCGFIPRCALEEDDGGNVRLEKIHRLIQDCKFGIHDISRTELDLDNSLPRFNMPLELGIFLGARKFGGKSQKTKNCLILDHTDFRYQIYLSDIAGQDIRNHKNDPDKVIPLIRNWLNTASGRKTIPGGNSIKDRYKQFNADLPAICKEAKIDIDELTFNDYSNFISNWLLLSAET